MNEKDFEYIVKDFPHIENYKLIGIFGGLNQPLEERGDIDLITIGGNTVHKNFLIFLKNKLIELGFKPSIFQTTKQQTLKKNKKHILIHDLHYSSIQDLLKKEQDWKTVIIGIKKETYVLYGNRDLLNKIPPINIEIKDIIFPFKKWSKEIKNKKGFDIFITHLEHYYKRILPKHTGVYSNIDFTKVKLFLKESIKMSKKYKWKIALNKINK